MDNTCDQCGAVFHRRADRPGRFCSTACNYASKRTESTCPSCGKNFTRKSSRAGIYCSTSCSPGRPRDESNYLDKVCPGCDKMFTCSKYKETEFCSSQCRTNHCNITQACAYCGEMFTFQRSWPRIHCSRKCYGLSKTLGGKKYYGANWQIQRSRAIVRDDGKCVDCGSDSVNLHVHHLLSLRSFDGDWKLANVLENLVTVCPPCHLTRHGGHY